MNYLKILTNNNTRPTSDRAKEALFNIVGTDILDCKFLDLFSGSGAIGLEAASRGAKKVILCDNNKEAINIIKKNIEKTHLEDKVELYEDDYKNILDKKIKEPLDIIYLDPPYKSDDAIIALEKLIEKKLITIDSLIIIETDRKEEIENKLKQIEIIDDRKYGRAEILFLKKVGQND